MTPGFLGRNAGRIALIGGLLVLCGLIITIGSAQGTKAGLWDYRAGFTGLAYGMALLVLGVLPAIVGAALTGAAGRPLAALISLVIAVTGTIALLIPLNHVYATRTLPTIHDITTDPDDPPTFEALRDLRADAENTAEYEALLQVGEQSINVPEAQRQAYPDIGPVTTDMPTEMLFNAALTTARALGWTIVAADADTGRIEATDATFWFGFIDDIALRVEPALPSGAHLDIRSASRVGAGDGGRNADRIRAFRDALIGHLYMDAPMVGQAPPGDMTDAPYGGEGPYSDGPYTDGPYTDGPYTEGPYTEGPYTEGPYTDEPYADGAYPEETYPDAPDIDGPYTEGPYTDGPYTDEPYTEDPGIDESFPDDGVP